TRRSSDLSLGLDRPIYVQYASWLANVLHVDLGTSLWYKTPVWHQLKDRFLVTMELAVMAIVLAVCAAVPLGVTSAVKQDTGLDYLSRIFSSIGIALPTFWLGILIVYFLAYFFEWLPPLGYATVWDDPLLNLQQLILPALTLAFNDLAFTARVTRSSMLEVMREDYLRTARAKGLKELRVVGRHALKNALLPVLTVSGYQFGRLLGGVIIVESIFVVPGMGTLLIDSIVPPGSAYLLGTDHVGRDILSRIIHGARISLYVGVGAVLIGVTGWFVVGMASAYAGGAVDLVVQRIVDVMMAVPGLIIVLAIMAVLGSSLNNVIIAIVIGMLAPVVRTVRSQVLSVKEMEYIVAARAIGASAP